MKSFFATDPVSHKGETNIWLTPKWILDELGDFDLDPCAAPTPRPFPTAKRMIAEADADGLAAEWEGRVWLNPPYGKNTGPWLQRLRAHGNGIALVFARTETNWLQPIMECTGVFFLKGRIKFIRPDGSTETNAGAPSILLPFGRKNVASILNSNLQGVWKP